MDVAECPRRLRHHCKALDLAIRIAPRSAPQTGKEDRIAISRREIEFGLGFALLFLFDSAIGRGEEATTPERLAKLRQRLRGLGCAVDIRGLPFASPPFTGELAPA